MKEQGNDTETRLRIEAVLGLLTHELNGPLGVGVTGTSFISDLAKTLLAKLASDSLGRKELETTLEEIVKSSDAILESLDRATQTVFKSRTRLFEFTSTEVREQSVREAWDRSLARVRTDTGVAVHASCKVPATLRTTARSGVLEAIFGELVRNSAEHGRDKDGNVEVWLECEKLEGRDSVKLLYRDSGSGIPAEALATIFKPKFFELNGKESSTLGLSIAHRLVSRYLQSSISFESHPAGGLAVAITMHASN